MAANMYRVGGEYRAQGLRGPRRERSGSGAGEARHPAARGAAPGAAWSRARTGTGTGNTGSEGAGPATRGGAPRLPERLRAAPTALSGSRRGPLGRGVGPGKVIPKELTGHAGGAGGGRPEATALPPEREPTGGFLLPAPRSLLCAWDLKDEDPALESVTIALLAETGVQLLR